MDEKKNELNDAIKFNKEHSWLTNEKIRYDNHISNLNDIMVAMAHFKEWSESYLKFAENDIVIKNARIKELEDAMMKVSEIASHIFHEHGEQEAYDAMENIMVLISTELDKGDK